MTGGKAKWTAFLLLLLLLAIPVTVYVTMQQQETRSRAVPATTLSLSPTSLTKTVGDEVILNVSIDTGTNTVAAAEIYLQYDPAKLTALRIEKPTNPFLPVILGQGTIQNGVASIALGSELTTPKKGVGTLATITFRALAATGTRATEVRFANNTLVGGIGEQTNVAATMNPASITIATPTTSSASLPTEVPTPLAFQATTPVTTSQVLPTSPPPAALPVTASIEPTILVASTGIFLLILGAIFAFAF